MRVKVAINITYDNETVESSRATLAMLEGGLNCWIGSGGLTASTPLIVDSYAITVKRVED